jgi:hypothetical protein
METNGHESCEDYDLGEEATVEEESAAMRRFQRALMDGDAKKAGESLRQLRRIDGYMKDVLADMLEGNPDLEPRFPRFLKFAGRAHGAPPNSPSRERELEEQAWRAVRKYYPNVIKKLEDKGGAFAKAAKELNWSAAKVKKYYYFRNERNLGD